MSSQVIEKRSKISDFVQLLEWRERDGMLTVTPKDAERFSIKLNRAIEVLRRVSDAEPVMDQMRLLLRTFAEWLTKRTDIESAYLTMRDGGLCLLLVRNEVLYNEAFEDAVTDLEIGVANDIDLNLVKVNVLALPRSSEEAISTFLDPEFSIKYVHGNSDRQHLVGQQGP